MSLDQLTQRIYYLKGREETDRPFLYYIKGDFCSAAVDAGNSQAHVQQFYRAIRKKKLPVA